MLDRNKNELNHGDEVYFYASLRHEWMMGFVRKINFDENEALVDNGPKDNSDLRENDASYSAWVSPAELIKIFPKTQAVDVDAVEVTSPVEQTLAEVAKEASEEIAAEVVAEVAVEASQTESKPRPRPEWNAPQEKNSGKSERGYRPRESRD
jgi:hypothetical protein